MSAGHAASLVIIARARRPVRRLLRDKRGISAVEFAMLLPLMVTLYLGGVEVSQAVAIDRKVTLIARIARRPGRAGDQRSTLRRSTTSSTRDHRDRRPVSRTPS